MADPHIHTTGTIRITTLFEKGGCYAEGGVPFLQRHPAPGGGRRLCPYWR